MLKRIIEYKKARYDELERLLADPKTMENKLGYQTLAKELASLKPIVDEYNAYLKLQEDIGGLDKVLNEKGHDKEFIVLAEEEKHRLEKALKESESRLEMLLLEKESDSGRDIIMEIRAGTGGLEASLFAGDLLRMYTKYAFKKSWKVEMIDSSVTEKGGYKEVVFSISGKGVYGALKFESGAHRVQRVPETETSGRIHTSTATVAVLPEAEEVEVDVRPEDLKIDTFRASGKGGQHVNRTDSAVRITHIPTSIVVSCQDERSQYKNKTKALKVLRAKLFDRKRSEQAKNISQARRAQVGTGDRSEKIRTYNYPDRRVTDHRVGLVLHNLENILEGELDEIIGALKEEEKRLKLAR